MTIMDKLVKSKANLETLKEELTATFLCEKESYKNGGYSDDVTKGWIEALEYVLKQMRHLEVK